MVTLVYGWLLHAFLQNKLTYVKYNNHLKWVTAYQMMN